MKGIKHKIELTEIEETFLQDLITVRGYREEMVFSVALRMLHKKEFPPYVKKKVDPGLSLEEQCVQKGGEVIEKDGIKQCRIQHGALEVFEPIN